jgi:hypothetical protein
LRHVAESHLCVDGRRFIVSGTTVIIEFAPWTIKSVITICSLDEYALTPDFSKPSPTASRTPSSCTGCGGNAPAPIVFPYGPDLELADRMLAVANPGPFIRAREPATSAEWSRPPIDFPERVRNDWFEIAGPPESLQGDNHNTE